MAKKVLKVSSKLFVLENVFILLVSYFVKIVHVELPYKRGKVSMSKVNG
jgi:hypothetical protein